MPGLSQLKNFSQNLLSLGDEVVIRSARGEKPVRVKIPKGIADADDSEDFILGMPQNRAEQEEEKVDNDLSDLMGLARQGENENDAENRDEPAPSFEAPDLSSILNPISAENADSEDDMPDLSMFEDNPAEEDDEPEPPEEVSIADMGLDALLAGSGFDGSEGKDFSEENDDEYFSDDYDENGESGENNENAENSERGANENRNEISELEILDDKITDEKPNSDDPTQPSPTPGAENFDAVPDLPDLENLDGATEQNAGDETNVANELGDLSGLADMPDLGDLGDTSELDAATDLGDFDASQDLSDLGDLSNLGDENDLSDFDAPGDVTTDLPDLGELNDSENMPDLSDLGNLDAAAEQNAGDETNVENELGDLSGLADMPDLGDLGDTSGLDAATDLGDLGDTGGLDGAADLGDFDAPGDVTTDLPDLGELGSAENIPDLSDLGNFDDTTEQNASDETNVANELGDLSGLADMPDLGDLGDTSGLDGAADLGDLGDLSNLGNENDLPDFGAPGDAATDLPDLGELNDSENMLDLSDLGNLDDAAEQNASDETNIENELGDLSGLADMPDLGDLGDTGGLDGATDLGDFDASQDLSDLGDLGNLGDENDLSDFDAPDDAATDLPDLGDLGSAENMPDLSDLGNLDGATEQNASDETNVANELGDLSGLADMPDLGDLGDTSELDGATDLGDFDASQDLSDLGDLGNLGDENDLSDFDASGDATTDLPDLDELNGTENMPDLSDLGNLDDATEQNAGEETNIANELGDLSGLADMPDLGDLGDTSGLDGAADFGDFDDTGGLDGATDLGDFDASQDLSDLGDLSNLGGENDLSDFDASGDVTTDLPDLGELNDSGDMPDLSDLGNLDGAAEQNAGDETNVANELGDLSGLADMPDLGDLGDTSELDGATDLGDFDASQDLSDLGDLGNLGDENDLSDFDAPGDAATDLPDLGELGSAENMPDLSDLGNLDGATEQSADEKTNVANELGDLSGLADMPDLGDLGDTSGLDAATDLGDFDASQDLSDLGDLGDTSGLDAATETNASDETPAAPEQNAGEETFGLDDIDGFAGGENESSDFSVTDDIPDYNDSLFDNDSENQNQENEVTDISIDDFDISAMDNMDFGIEENDSKSNPDAEDGADFLMDGDFEIPGFSDVATIKEEKKAPLLQSKKDAKKSRKNISEADFSEAEESEELPPNTLSDSQYKQFLKNLSEYPLNVRLAFENLIVQDEFTDDAEFEIIEKILNKAPARQVAGLLEKMLDTSIPVPRDYEHRTAEEYEAYKKSLSYQLRNRIIPACLIGITLFLVSLGLFHFSKNCIYKPLKANGLYKQGYALLEADEYPQSEMKFEQAVKYRVSKKWFFNYARGYRNHKQYQRAASMYDRILSYFKHDKAAGLEYADMELNDMANYERAEEIVRREVLDYHINDADGILKLGDIFLEWGTEKDPEKLEFAREQYANLLQLYGKDRKRSDLYLSRMMRYFIRTDNLKEVLPLKKFFEPREKSLSSDDWAELSGYLLDKYYGILAPSEEYLRYEIDGLRGLLMRAVKTNPDNPIAYYNLSKYFIESGENGAIESALQTAIEKFNTIPFMKKRDIYKYIDSYRLLGEQYIDMGNYLQAQEQFSEGISLFVTERDNAGFEGNADIGKLYADLGNIKYSVSGDYDDALTNYKYSIDLGNDTQSIRYRIGYIQYKKNNYGEALGSFMKAGDGNVKERNLMLAMANTLFMRDDDYAAEGYYSQLIDTLDREIEKYGIVFPQTNSKDYDIVNTYLYAANNYGVTLYKLAKRTGNSALNAQAIVQFSQSLRAWDALTRNQETLERLPGSNLAEQNIKYITHPIPEFEPSIYTDIPKTLMNNEKL